MSNRNNVVFNVLPATGNVAVLAKNQTIGNLAEGQIGFFDYDTGLSFDATSTPPKRYFIARGKGGGDFRKSAGEAIQKNGTFRYMQKVYNAGQPMFVTIATGKAKCDTEYGVRLGFQNSAIFRTIGHGQFSKAYLIKTPCCDGCAEDDCDSFDAAKMLNMLATEINNDTLGLVTAVIVATGALTDTEVPGLVGEYAEGNTFSDEDLALIFTFNETAVTKIVVALQLTTNPIAVGAWCQVNLNYHKLLETVVNVSLLEGLSCSGTTVVTQYPVFAEGTGKNVMQKEYHASGWNGAGPYVLSETTGTAKGNIEYLADANTNYTQFACEYEVKSEGGWLEYENPLTTFIAIPASSATTIASVKAVLDILV